MSNPFADLSTSTANPFTSARVVGEKVEPSKYFTQTAKRGTPEYVVSRSDLVGFSKCPRRWLLGYESEESESMAWGSLIDVLLLTPERFATDYAVKPPTYIDDEGVEKKWNGNAKACKEWEEQNTGKKLVASDAYDAARLAIARMKEVGAIRELVENSRKQVMAEGVFDDTGTGLKIKTRCMIDLVPPKDWLADLKTGRDLSYFNWKWTVFRSQYHVQAAFYLDHWNMATGDERELFAYVGSENTHPYEPAAWYIGADFITIGRGAYVKALQDYCLAVATGEWRGYEGDEGDYNGFGLITPDPKMILQGA